MRQLHCTDAREHAELPEEAVARDRLTYASWGGGLSLEQYLDRERRLWRQAFARRGMRRWILREGAADLASCETYLVPVRVGTQLGVGHGVASVFTEERLRGRGLAAELLSRVHDVLRGEGAVCAYLMSEIGPQLYGRLGYVVRPPLLRRYAAAGPSEAVPAALEWFGADDVAGLVARRYAAAPLHRRQLVLQLTAEQLLWHVERGWIYADHQGRARQRVVGARAGAAFGIFAADPQKGVVRVLMLYPGEAIFAAGALGDPHSDEAARLRDVLHGARFLAAELGLPAVEVWENGQNAGWLRGGHRVEGSDIPMVLPLRDEVRGEDWLDWERGHWL